MLETDLALSPADFISRSQSSAGWCKIQTVDLKAGVMLAETILVILLLENVLIRD